MTTDETLRRTVAPTAPGVTHRPVADLALAVSVALVVAQACFRAWALLPSWFYTDDYRLLLQAHETPFSLQAVLTPFDSQFMPAGRLISYGVLSSGELSWAVAAAITLLLSTAASAACLYMLVTLFGRGWATTALMGVFVTTTITTPALMWWAAALNQVGPQACFFLAVAWWVRYLRTRRTRLAVLSLLAVAVALSFYVKALLFPLVLAFVTLVHFSSGPWRDRVRGALRQHWRIVVPTVLAAAGFVAWYSLAVQQAYVGSGAAKVGEVAESMLGTSLPVGLLGGPWMWWNTSPPIVLAQPPSWAVHLSWVVLALAIAHTALRRRHSWGGWALIGGYALLDFALLATSRGQEYGAFAGLDYRYLTDLAPVAVLGIGLATLDLRGAVSGSVERRPALLRLRLPVPALVVGTCLVGLGGVISTVGYVHFWHHENAGSPYVRTLMSEIDAEPVDLVNQTMPTTVMPDYTFPVNQTQNFVELLRGEVRFPEVSGNLQLINESGHLVPAGVDANIDSEPGPREGCGWRVADETTVIPLQGEAFEWGWWTEIAYLAAESTTLEVTMGDTTTEVPFKAGLGRVLVHVTAEFDEVSVAPSDEEVPVCIDKVLVGNVTPR